MKVLVIFISVLLMLFNLSEALQKQSKAAAVDVKKHNYPKSNAATNYHRINSKSTKKEMKPLHFRQRQPRDVENVEENLENLNTTPMALNDNEPKIVLQEFTKNSLGEYRYEMVFNDATRKVERGDFEDRNGTRVFVIRGIYWYNTPQNETNSHIYILDNLGYHEIKSIADPSKTADSSVAAAAADAEVEKCPNGSYCVDSKLLAIMVR